MTTTTERDTITLTYLGRRWNGTKVVHGWQDRGGEDRLYAMAGQVIGGKYTVEVDETGTKVYPATLSYIGLRSFDQDQVALWEAEDQEVRRTASRQKAERAAARDSRLDDALEPLLALAGKARTRYQAQALAHAASERIMEAYWKGDGR